MKVSQNPIFIFACSPRSGSTWLQRVITGTGVAMIWGEAAHGFFDYTTAWTLETGDVANPHDLHSFLEKDVAMWMAMLNPELKDAIAANKLYLERLYGVPSKAMGYRRWGCKQTRYGMHSVNAVSEAWPKSRIVFLVRNFEQAFQSRFKYNTNIQGFSRGADVQEFCELWESQATVAHQCRDRDNCRIVKYEDLRDDRKALQRLLRWLGLSHHTVKLAAHDPVSVSVWSKDVRVVSMEDLGMIAPFRQRIDYLQGELGYEPIAS